MLAIVTVITNMLLIPEFGIDGAEMAIFTLLVIYNLVRSFYVYNHLNIQLFSKKTLIGFIILLVTFILGTFLP